MVIGGLQEGGLARGIQRQAPRARDLTGRTDFAQIAVLGARAALAIGNDTGPLHLIAAAGAPTIVLFSSASDPGALGAARAGGRLAGPGPDGRCPVATVRGRGPVPGAPDAASAS